MQLSKRTLCMTGMIALGMSGGNAYAQTGPLDGSELRGHTVDVVFADGTSNSVFFAPNGQAQINGAGANATGSWSVRGNQLCLQSGNMQECWNYSQRFVAGRPLSLASSCNETSRWTARSVNPPPPAPQQEVAPVQRGERG
jgi:hypothetical protein